MYSKYLSRIEKEFNAEKDLIVTDEVTWRETMESASAEWLKVNSITKLSSRVIFIENLNQLVFVRCRY